MTPGKLAPESWKLHVDGSSNSTYGGAGVILENQDGITIEQSVRYEFPVSNNQAEYEALLAGLSLAREVGAKVLEVNTDSQGSWTYPILQYLLDGTLPPDPKEEKRIKRKSPTIPLSQDSYTNTDSRNPCSNASNPRTRSTYSVKSTKAAAATTSEAKLKNCDKCQRHANIHQAAPHQLSIISAERPFGTWGIDLVGPFPTAPGQLKYLIVAIDYYTKWIEAEPLSSITATQCRKFLWRQIITRFGIPEIIILDNGTQFTDKKFREFLEGLRVSHRFSSVEHPQTNGQVESANKIIVKGLKKRLDEAKGLWADELGSVLWSYRTTPQTTTGETPFRLTYGVEAVIPVEIGDPSPRKTVRGNDEEAERDLIDETRSITHLRELALKQRISLRYNHGVIRREFAADDLVLRRNDIGPPTPGEGKLTPNWEGPYRIKAVIGKGAYKFERLNGNEVPRTWNAANLRRYYA
ncbi:uncharacterized protein K02A2.6-like [Arachis ipaensis]|uniref:uncharacterized protein K02A2.6-like n=1 Tax=Arachis ipaensis TaxID=130454 RepID=UPI0007AF8340|nr:uncharacterized protein K02A2.6-like [Arachis ipaensis]